MLMISSSLAILHLPFSLFFINLAQNLTSKISASSSTSWVCRLNTVLQASSCINTNMLLICLPNSICPHASLALLRLFHSHGFAKMKVLLSRILLLFVAWLEDYNTSPSHGLISRLPLIIFASLCIDLQITI